MNIVAKTDPGKKRDNNQDSYSCGELANGVYYAIVCDGMGGAAEGAYASRETVRMVRERLVAGFHERMSDLSIKNLLKNAVSYANAEIFSISETDEKYNGMGTTIVAAVITSEYIYIVHAGDSRAYLIYPERNEYSQLTRDHSVVQKMIEDGEISAEEAVDHPKKHLITKAVGTDDTINVDFCQEEYEEGDILLLCSDGLTNFVSNIEFVEMANTVKFIDYASKLVNKANDNGGGDNITVIAVKL